MSSGLSASRRLCGSWPVLVPPVGNSHAYVFCRYAWRFRKRVRNFLPPLKAQRQVDQLRLAELLQITAMPPQWIQTSGALASRSAPAPTRQKAGGEFLGICVRFLRLGERQSFQSGRIDLRRSPLKRNRECEKSGGKTTFCRQGFGFRT